MRGLSRHGFQCEAKHVRNPMPDDLLVIWNRNRVFDPIANVYERAGARVMVCENGYLDRAADGSKYYAVALDAHNGAGRWFVGDEPRFKVDELPWRETGSKVLVLPQRGIGQQGVAMPSTWPQRVLERIKTDREIVVRPHPGHQRMEQPLDFRDVWCCVTWGSGAAIKALRQGIPVFHEFPRWIGAPGASQLAGNIEACHTPDRRLLWTRITWAQWTLEEIGSGEAFDRLLHARRDSGLFCAS